MERHHLQHSRELHRDQRLTRGGGIGVVVHQYWRDHGEDGRTDSSCQRVAESGQGRQVRDEWIAWPQMPPQHVCEDRCGEVVVKEV